MVKCVVSGCPNRTANSNRAVYNRTPKRFFSFPNDPARVKVWLAALRETDKQDSTEQHLICEDHFLSEDVSADGVNSDAIPIMPPFLDGPLGLVSPWGAESSDEEEEEQWTTGGCEEQEEDVGGDDSPPAPDPAQQDPGGGLEDPGEAEKTSAAQRQGKHSIHSDSRQDLSLGLLTQRFLELLLAAPDSSVDLRQVATTLETRRQRVYDITNILNGINLIQKESSNRIKWIGKCPVSSFLWKNQQKFQRELENLKLVEDTLDGLIKSCAQQLFDMTDDVESSAYPLSHQSRGQRSAAGPQLVNCPENNLMASLPIWIYRGTQNSVVTGAVLLHSTVWSAYVTHEDVSRLRAFQEQTVIVVKAPEETKLEIPAPREDIIQIHLKAGRAPIMVVTCEVGSGDGVTSDPEQRSSFFSSLDKSRIRTTVLHTGASAAPQSV